MPTVRIEINVSIQDSNYLSAHAREAGKSVCELASEIVASAVRSASDNDAVDVKTLRYTKSQGLHIKENS